MKNKKAFTLIELLAVIVVLSVVVAITVPVVSKSIENSKKNSAIESANGLIQSAEYYFLTASPKYGKIDVLNEKLNFKGEKPDLGEVEINKQGKSRIYTYVNGYCITKEFGTELYANKTNKEDCSWFGTDNYETTEGTTFTLNNQSVKNYLIYGNSIQATRSGKNLLNMADFTETVSSSYYNNTATNFKLTAGKTYTLSFYYKVNSATATFTTGVGYGTTNYSTDIIYSKQYPNQTSGRQTVTFTAPSNLADGNYLFIRFVRFESLSSASVTISRIQLEEGSSATAYEEYGTMPSPEFPSEIKSVGDLLTSSNCSSYGSDACNNVGKYVIQVKDRGKNLFDYSYLNQQDSSGGLTMTSTGDVITINGTLTNSGNIKLSDVFPNIFDVNKTYTLKIDVVGGSGAIGEGTGITFAFSLFNSSNTKYIRTNVNATVLDNIASVTFSGSVFAGEEKLHLLLQNWRLGNTYSNYQVRIQIEEGSSATSYESYKEKITNIYLDEPLRNIGDYVDYIDYANGKVVRNVGETIFKGNENWNKFSSTNKYYVLNGLPTIYKPKILVLSNRFFGRLSGSGKQMKDDKYTYIDGDIWLQSVEDYPRLYIYKDGITTVQNLKTWLSNNNITVVYPLNKPKEETIDLPNIELLDGTSTLQVNTTVSPSNVKLTTNK